MPHRATTFPALLVLGGIAAYFLLSRSHAQQKAVQVSSNPSADFQPSDPLGSIDLGLVDSPAPSPVLSKPISNPAASSLAVSYHGVIYASPTDIPGASTWLNPGGTDFNPYDVIPLHTTPPKFDYSKGSPFGPGYTGPPIGWLTPKSQDIIGKHWYHLF
jgi:hypothetical protein